MSRLHDDGQAKRPSNERQISLFRDLRRLYGGIPASLANSSGIFLAPSAHFDLARAGSALYGVNPTPDLFNPMLPVIELRARILQVRNLGPGESIADNIGRTTKRRMRVAFPSDMPTGIHVRPQTSCRCWSEVTPARLLGIHPWICCRSM